MRDTAVEVAAYGGAILLCCSVVTAAVIVSIVLLRDLQRAAVILHRPGPVKRAADIEQYGEWVFCIWKRVEEYIIVWQWARRKVISVNNSQYNVTWRKADNTVITSNTYEEPPGW